jgi:prepilin-type N-terminal cleavage/methylation domain-containing protein
VTRRLVERVRLRAGPDDGVTLLEMVVAMTLMTLFMAMFTGAVVQMFGVLDRGDATSTVQAQLNVAFLRLDREIRYAAGITTPGQGTGGDWYVEYLTSTTSTCGQLRLHVATGAPTASLQLRSWSTTGSPPPGWTTLATGLAAGQPFSVKPADATSNFVRLELTVTASSGAARYQTSRRTDVTFTALNSRPETDPQTGDLIQIDMSACQQGR